MNRRPEDPTPPGSSGSTGVYLYRFENVEFDEARSVLTVAGSAVSVEPLPLHVLTMLLRRPDEAISRAELHDAIWHGRTTVDHVLPNAVNKLRRALGASGATRLLTLPRIGYRLRGPIDRIATGRRPQAAPDLLPNRAVPHRPDFLLVRALGGASTGAVWLARHRQLSDVRVFKFAADGDRLAALKREFTVCRLLARELGPRPDLVTLKDSNFSEPPFYLAYEHAGIDLRAWAQDGERLAGLDLGARIDLFLRIAHAVAAAHGVGVLHRDLKPANILVDADAVPPQVRLIDFGSGQLLAPERLQAHAITAFGMSAGNDVHPLSGLTPNYLAPELLNGAPTTTRSDLYALGLILYQIVAGDLSRPLANGWEADIGDPLLVEDIRAATEGRPALRLASVAQLIERLESLSTRHARQAEAEAAARRLEAIAERLATMRARRRRMAAVAGCLAVSGCIAGWFGVQARAAQAAAEQATARAQAVNDFLNVDLLRPVNLRQALPNPARLDVLSRASDRAGERFKGDAPVLGQVRRQLGDLYFAMHYLDRAETDYRRAIVVLDPVVRTNRAEWLSARFGLARTLAATHRLREARDLLEESERLAAEAPGSADDVSQRRLRAAIELALESGRPRDALALAERLLRATDHLSSLGELNTEHRREAREWLAEAALELGDGARAEALTSDMAAPPFNDPDARGTIAARVGLRQARRAIGEGRWADAERTLLALRGVTRDAWQLGQFERALLEVNRANGRFADALRAGEAAVRAYTDALGPNQGIVVLARVDRAIAALDSGQPEEALRDLERLRPRLDASAGTAVQRRRLDLGRARALNDLGRPAEALALLEDRSAAGPASVETDGAVALRREWQAERGRAEILSGQAADGRARVADAVDAMRRDQAPAWQIARYETLFGRNGSAR